MLASHILRSPTNETAGGRGGDALAQDIRREADKRLVPVRERILSDVERDCKQFLNELTISVKQCYEAVLKGLQTGLSTMEAEPNSEPDKKEMVTRTAKTASGSQTISRPYSICRVALEFFFKWEAHRLEAERRITEFNESTHLGMNVKPIKLPLKNALTMLVEFQGLPVTVTALGNCVKEMLEFVARFPGNVGEKVLCDGLKSPHVSERLSLIFGGLTEARVLSTESELNRKIKAFSDGTNPYWAQPLFKDSLPEVDRGFHNAIASEALRRAAQKKPSA